MVEMGAIISLLMLLAAVVAGANVRTEARWRVHLIALAPVVVSVLAWMGIVIAVEASVNSIPETIRNLPFVVWATTIVAPTILLMADLMNRLFRPSGRSTRGPAAYLAPVLTVLTIGVLYGVNELVSAHTKFYRWRGSASDDEYWIVAICLLIASLGRRQRWVLTGPSMLGGYAGWLASARWSQLSGFYNGGWYSDGALRRNEPLARGARTSARLWISAPSGLGV